MTLGHKIRLVRKNKDITAEFMAQKLHCAESTYNKIERGETEITVKKLQEIADALGVSKQYIEEYEPSSSVRYYPPPFA